MKSIFTTILFLIPLFSISQIDSIILIHDQLGAENIIENKITPGKEQVISASRSLKNLKDLPFTIHVISKEEILRNGYTTLVDVVKMLPGIRVSQPGSALEGETFMMRGLQGNTYTKILLNGNPIRPSVVKGMPIGAQIPIKQAQRIEIIYGPAATLYGADASAGIINIILEETDRPVYTQANLSVGTQGFTNLDIGFGGKLGKQKNTLKYSLYGSYTFLNDHRIDRESENYNYENYEIDFFTNIESIPNYVGQFGTSKPIFSTMPHLSQMFGVNLNYRTFKFSAEIMSRRDHSSLGLNPEAVAFSNPLNFIGERISNFNFSVGKQYKKFSYQVKASYLQYLMDNQSSHTYVNNLQSQQLQLASYVDSQTFPFDQMKFDSLNDSHNKRFFDGTRFSYAESHDIGLDLSFNFYPLKNVEITTGGILRYFGGVPLTQFSTVPFDRTFFNGDDQTPRDKDLVPFRKNESNSGNFSSYVQLYWTLKNFNFVGGLQYYVDFENQFKPGGFERIQNDNIQSLNPRLAAIYSINKNLSLRAFYGEAFQIPSGYYFASAYLINLNNPLSPLSKTNFGLRPEKTKTIEFGIRWIPEKNIRTDVVLFYSKTNNLISFDKFNIVEFDSTINNYTNSFIQGFRNSEFSYLELVGMQADFSIQNINIIVPIDFGFNFSIYAGEENIPGIGSRDQIREYPTFIGKSRISMHTTDNVTLTFDNIFMSNSSNRMISLNRSDLGSFYTLDIVGNYKLSRNFTAFFRMNNVFNKRYAGLNASSTDDDLLFNPQELRTFRLGMTYRIN